MKTLLKGAKYYTRQQICRGDIAIEDGVITNISSCGDVCNEQFDRVVDLDGCVVFPGFVDVHVHLREPGFSYKERIASGTRAAARGGVTTLFTMPNLSPAPDSLENLAEQQRLIEQDAVVNVIPYASITKGQKGCGELVDFEALAAAVCGFSDDGRGVQSAELMREAMCEAKRVGRPIVAHCEVDDLLFGGYIHDGEYCKANGYKGICSESEWAQVKRDIELVEQTGCQYHVCHVSTKESVELVREAKAKGLKVSCETAAHYLLMCDGDLQEDGRFKMNPPIRSAADRDALLRGIVDGAVEVVATDHAPHSAEEKSRGLAGSAFGIVGIETTFALLYTYLVLRDVITLNQLVELMSTSPRRLFAVGGGVIEVGADADLVAMDLETEYKIDPAEFLSQGRATPFEGWSVKGRTRMTMVAGEMVYEDLR
ncbi:MAG: dihydroorotase [Rikenellaceae bacterium]